MTENNSVTEDDYGKLFELSHSGKSMYNDPNIIMVSWWVTYAYFNNEKIRLVIFK